MTRAAVLALLLALACCGGRTTPAPLREASADAQPQADPEPDAGTLPCTWALSGPATRVSGEPQVAGDVHLAGAAAVGGAAIVAWHATANSTSKTVVTRLVGFDGGPIGDEHVVLQSGSMLDGFGDVALSAGFGRVAVSATQTSRGCVLQRLTMEGAPNGAPLATSGRCSDLATTQTGFDVFRAAMFGQADRVLLDRLDVSGAPLGSPTVLFETTSWERIMDLDRAARRAGGFFGAASSQGTTTAFVAVRPFDALGNAITPGQTFLTPQGTVVTVSLAETGAGVVAAWAANAEVERATLSADGAIVRGQGVLAVATQRITALHVAPDGAGAALLGWVDHGSGGSAAYVRLLDEAGDVAGAPIVLGAPDGTVGFGPALRIVASSGRALAVVEAFSGGASHWVYAVPLHCRP